MSYLGSVEISSMLVVRCQTQNKGLVSFWLGFFVCFLLLLSTPRLSCRFFNFNILAVVCQKGKYFLFQYWSMFQAVFVCLQREGVEH